MFWIVANVAKESRMMCLWLQRQLEQHIIPHVSAALLEAVSPVVCVMHSSHSANTQRSPSARTHLLAQTCCTHRKSAWGLSIVPAWGVFLLDYPNSTLPLKSFKLQKFSSFPWYLAGLMTIKTRLLGLKVKEAANTSQKKTKQTKTSLINTTKCNLISKGQRL